MIAWKRQDQILEGHKGQLRFFIFLDRQSKPRSLYVVNGEEKEKFLAEKETLEDLKQFAELF